MKKELIIIFILSFTFSACGQEHQTFKEMAKEMSKGTAPKIDATTLNESHFQKIIYLDAREKEEYEVSHIKGAIYVGYDDFEMTNVPDLKGYTTIVVYCSVGYRSEKIAEKLIKNGFPQTKNLYGGIFHWVNSGYSVYDNQEKETQNTHGYSKSWGKWLTKGVVVYE